MNRLVSSLRSFLARWLIPRLGSFLIRCIGVTLRVRYLDPWHIEEILHSRQNVIFAFWHNRLMLMPYIYVHKVRRTIAVMVSQSKDGQLMSDVIARFGFRPVRGSTTRGGKVAFREMIKLLQAGCDGGFTPDGPRGPRYEAGPGVVMLAHLTGLPIVPASWAVSHKITLNSWDKMVIPLPFARCVFIFGKPIDVGKDANPNVLQEKLLEVKTALTRLTDRTALEIIPPAPK